MLGEKVTVLGGYFSCMVKKGQFLVVVRVVQFLVVNYYQDGY